MASANGKSWTHKKTAPAAHRRQRVHAAGPAALQPADPRALQRTLGKPRAASPNNLLYLQSVTGNRAVNRLIQPKLLVSPAGDKSEQEADRMAQQVAGDTASAPNSFQHEIDHARDIPTKPPVPGASAEAGFIAGDELTQRLTSLKGGGRPLPDETRTRMESAMGANFSEVRVHTGAGADQLNRALQARAFTNESDIYFGEGRYSPDRSAGRQLLAHELTHVVQQGGSLQHESGSVTSNAPGIQRDYLDQKDKTEAFSTATKGMGDDKKQQKYDFAAKAAVLAAVGKYQAADSADLVDVNVIRKAIVELGKTAFKYLAKKISPSMRTVLEQLQREVKIVVDDFEFTEKSLKIVANPKWEQDPDNVAGMKRETEERGKKYSSAGKPGVGKGGLNKGIAYYLGELAAKATQAESRWLNKKSGEQAYGLSKEESVDWGYKYGNKNGEIDEKTGPWVEDFKQIELLMKRKEDVLRYLRPLADHIGDKEDKLAALKEGLRVVEKKAGFDHSPLIPLGVLPGDVFLKLMQEGHILDDFGAGLQHGELSHRFQWYAIIQGWLQNEIPLKHSPIDLYKTMNTGQFAQSRTGTSMWGQLLDAATVSGAPSYAYPGTLNRDLLEMDPKMDKTGVGLGGTRNFESIKYVMPKAIGLEPIGMALSQLKKIRTDQAVQAATHEELQSPSWRDMGVAPSSLTKYLEQEMGLSKDVEMFAKGLLPGQGAFSSKSEGKEWKVLKENEK